MPKYYCEYCKSYLTHDKPSVRKSHLAGRNHIRLYCEYYERIAKQLGLWAAEENNYEVTLDYLTSNAPLPRNYAQKRQREKEQSTVRRSNTTDAEICLPPPPTLADLPPPPSVLNHTEAHTELVSVHQARQSTY